VTRAFLSEWVKLRRLGMLYAAALVVAAAGLATGLSVATASDAPRGADQDGPGSGQDLASIVQAGGFAEALASGATLVGVIMLAIFGNAVASEFSLGTLRVLLVREPRRIRLMAGKLVALATFATAAVALAVAGALAVAVVSAQVRGLDIGDWFSAEGLDSLLRTSGELLLTSLGWGLIGALFGLVLRSPTTAIAAGLAYALPAEALLSAAWDEGARWLPGQLLQAIAEGGTSGVSLSRALVVFAIYAAIGLTAAGVELQRRDVTV
jgi:ABC-2 type transport system permease protein